MKKTRSNLNGHLAQVWPTICLVFLLTLAGAGCTDGGDGDDDSNQETQGPCQGEGCDSPQPESPTPIPEVSPTPQVSPTPSTSTATPDMSTPGMSTATPIDLSTPDTSTATPMDQSTPVDTPSEATDTPMPEDLDGDGYSVADGDCNDGDPSIHPGAAESCNEVDDTCDGDVDEGVTTVYYQDADQDGFGNLDETTEACEAPAGYLLDSSDCDDSTATIYPGADESCDDTDSNCDGVADDDLRATYYQDADADGFGTDETPIQSCSAVWGYALLSGDCDDTNASINPDALESCNGLDDNCDGTIDEGVTTTWYVDGDGDGHGSLDSSQFCDDPGAGWSLQSGDCADGDTSIYPGHVELCDGKDNDCNGEVDDNTTTYTFYEDLDSDGYGTEANTVESCADPGGYSLEAGDCDDTEAAIHPEAAEICDGIDNNCSGTVDESCWDVATWDEGIWGD